MKVQVRLLTLGLDTDFNKMLNIYFSHLGYIIETCPVNNFVEFCEQYQPSILLVDIFHTELSQIDFFAQMRCNPKTKTISLFHLFSREFYPDDSYWNKEYVKFRDDDAAMWQPIDFKEFQERLEAILFKRANRIKDVNLPKDCPE